MTKKLKLLTKIGILLFIVAITNYSCQKEENIEHDEQFNHNHYIDFSKLEIQQNSLNQLLNKTINIDFDNQKLKNIDFGLQNQISAKTYQKTSETILKVDTSNVYFAAYGHRNFTTFRIKENRNDNSFRNLIIENIDSDAPIAKILTYTPEETWLNSNKSFTPYEGKITSENFDGQWLSAKVTYCKLTQEAIWGCDWRANSGHKPGHPGCNGGNYTTGYVTTEECDSYGEASGGDSSGEASGGSSGSAGTGEDDLPLDSKLTKPLSYDTTIHDCLASFANMSLYNSVTSLDLNTRVQIANFIESNGCNYETKSFIQTGINTILNGGEVDFPNKVVLDSTYVAIDKVNCTYQQISLNSRIKNLLENFTGVESPNLKFQIISDLECNEANNPTGCTRSELESNNSITISIDQEYVNSNQTPTLFIARTIIHEAIHANMYLALYNEENGNTINLPDINDFPAIYEQYRLMKNAQHEFMAQHYTGLIAQILQEIHPLLIDQSFIDILNNDYPDMTPEQFYTSIAFLGLNETVGQTNYLNNPVNSEHYNISFYAAQSESTKTPNCN